MAGAALPELAGMVGGEAPTAVFPEAGQVHDFLGGDTSEASQGADKWSEKRTRPLE